MAALEVEVVTPERRVFAGEAAEVIAPAEAGQVTILPRHAALLSALVPGEVIILRPGAESVQMAVGGGFLEVRDDKVVILADSAERAEEIDVDRALQARRRAEILLHERPPDYDLAKAEAALRRSLVRIRVAERARRHGGGRQGGPSGGDLGE